MSRLQQECRRALRLNICVLSSVLQHVEEAGEQPRRSHPLDVPSRCAFLEKQLQTSTHAPYSPSEHKTRTEVKSKHTHQGHKRCFEQGVLTNIRAPEAWGGGIVVGMKAALFGLADGFYSPQQCKKGLCKRDFFSDVGQEKGRFLQPFCLEAVLDSLHGIKDHPWSCWSPELAADEIPDPWTTSKFKCPEAKLLKSIIINMLYFCAILLQIWNSPILWSFTDISSWKLVFSPVLAALSCKILSYKHTNRSCRFQEGSHMLEIIIRQVKSSGHFICALNIFFSV